MVTEHISSWCGLRAHVQYDYLLIIIRVPYTHRKVHFRAPEEFTSSVFL